MTELQALVRAAQDGDKDAFGQVVRRFQDMAYASAYATVGDACLAQDIAQEAFLEAYLNLSKLRDSSPCSSTSRAKCLYKINFIFFAKILDDLFHILDQMSKAGIRPKFDPFIFHKTPQYLNQIQFGRIPRQS